MNDRTATTTATSADDRMDAHEGGITDVELTEDLEDDPR